jgi:hypothetical protein
VWCLSRCSLLQRLVSTGCTRCCSCSYCAIHELSKQTSDILYTPHPHQEPESVDTEQCTTATGDAAQCLQSAVDMPGLMAYLKTASSPEVRIIYDISRGDEGAEGGAAAGSCTRMLLFLACWLTRRLNWSEPLSRAQWAAWAPTKGPSRRLNQRLGTIHGGAGDEARGQGSRSGWAPALVPDPSGHRNTYSYSLAPAPRYLPCAAGLPCSCAVYNPPRCFASFFPPR